VIRLIGGEMPAWTEDRPPAGGSLLRHLADRVPAGAAVLIAGPHEDTLIDALAARATVTCLVRSQPAASALDARGVEVLCGSLAKLPDTERWDVVVALDGLDRLCSVEGPQFDWAESLRALGRALSPGGSLLLATENELGAHRLVDTTTGTARQTDDAWRPLGEFDRTRPGTPARLTAALAAEGLTTGWLGAAWPLPGAPTLIATPGALTDGPVDALAALAARAEAVAYAESSVLFDPRRLAATAVRGGLGAELAPAWLVVAHAAPGPAAALDLPPVLLGGAAVSEVAPDADGEWTLPAGRLLEELLLGACLRYDRPALRRLLTGWTAALPKTAADNVIVCGDSFAVLDPGAGEQQDVLRRFARTLLTGGYAHPWPAATDLQTLTAILHGVAGLPGDVPDPRTGEDPPQPDSRREHEEQLAALHRRLAEAESRAQFFSSELGKREGDLQKARLQIATFSGSFGYRFAKLGYGVARKARNRLRKGTT
jgi:SAM-dependent methyltransferase